MDFAALNWMTLTVIGVALLAAAIAFAALRNRVSKPKQDLTERATRDLYDEEDRAHRGDGDGGY